MWELKRQTLICIILTTHLLPLTLITNMGTILSMKNKISYLFQNKIPNNKLRFENSPSYFFIHVTLSSDLF